MPERKSVWLRQEKSSRGRPALDRARIVSAALTLLDEDSVPGLTMRKLADRLGVPPMTLYGYVANKDDLLEYALDAVFAETSAAVDAAAGWRTTLEGIGIRTFEALLRHHWAAALVGTAPPMGPAAVAQFGTILEVLESAGFRDERLEAATTGFYYYVLGAALAESAWARGGSAVQAPAMEVPNLRDADGDGATLAAAFLARYANTDARERFRRGLSTVLDGLRPA
ncbi:TetR/AcrR family transcriptional regulator [Nocardia sp. CS682]|uniref:TetR/AcrR family transcriptional regulator n=1 Tax=Nocardia sp. CS682 TaxID=1047172 RepID=UPI001074AC96|nr:TetR/AcrR family transcriptional regulator C-terminal domain-containing protein [Nocardia sp. CS682]QBS44833.1 TetR family transcriptional regulator [Nocardia sp. CS682]